jgi:hypothetical protein
MMTRLGTLSTLALLSAVAAFGCNEHPVQELADTTVAETQEYEGRASANKVDILWVVDNSGSMCEEQADLRANFNNFITRLNEIGADFQLAVVTTDMQAPDESGRFQNIPDGTQGPSCTQSVDISHCPTENGEEAPPLIIRSEDKRYRLEDGNLDVDKLQRDFGCNATTGTTGYGFEMGLEAAKTSLDITLRTGYNAGFLRDDAYLAVIFLTDENDCSDRGRLDKVNGNVCEWFSDQLVPVSEYVDFFTQLKNGDPSRVIMAGIIAPDAGLRPGPGEDVNPSCVSTSGEGYAGYRYEELIRSFEASSTSDICNPPFDNALSALADLIVETVDNRCLTQPPATCETDADCRGADNTCQARGDNGRTFCTSFEVRVEVERPNTVNDLTDRECYDVAGTDKRRCILDPATDFGLNYDNPDCDVSGISVELQYALGASDDLIVRYPRSVQIGAPEVDETDDETTDETTDESAQEEGQ